MRGHPVGNKPSGNNFVLKVRNAESSATIPRGTPLVLKLSTSGAAGDGMDVVLPATAGNPLSYAARFGVACCSMAAGEYGEAILFGYCSYAIVTRATRAGATGTDSWSSVDSSASGIACGIDTVNNALVMGASIAGAVASNHIDAVLLDSIPVLAASATATTDTRTAITRSARVFVRML
jgi:hypothetical protein